MADNSGDKVRVALTKERGLVARGEYHYTASDETDKALDYLIVENRMLWDSMRKHQIYDNNGDRVRIALGKERRLVARREYHYTASDETDKALDRLIMENRMLHVKVSEYRQHLLENMR